MFLGELWLLYHLFLHVLNLGLVDELYGVDKVHVVLVYECGVLGELHEVGSLEEHTQLVESLLVLCLGQTVYNLAAGHLHRPESVAFLDILSECLCQLGVVFLLVLRGHHFLRLDNLYLLHRLLVWQQSLHYAYVCYNGFVVSQAQIEIIC